MTENHHLTPDPRSLSPGSPRSPTSDLRPRIKVLVVEDSPVVREFLAHVLGSDPEIQVIGTAGNGEEAIEVLESKKPDVITMDIHMPKMNGLEATRRIMETHPTPIIIVSGSENLKEVATTFSAMEAGALAVISRPKGIGHPEYEADARELVKTVKLMSEVRVIKRWSRMRGKPVVPFGPEAEGERMAEIRIVAIGASTGGPLALQTILTGLPKGFPVPVVIVQHIAAGFVQGFVEWLGQSSGFPVRVPTDSESLLPGHAYVAPDQFQMGVEIGNRIRLRKDEPENGLRPSISYLLRSIAKVYGRNAAGVLLTGMGKDGVEELRFMKMKGALTMAQDEESSVVYGMPGEAMRLNAATYVLPPDKIASVLKDLVR